MGGPSGPWPMLGGFGRGVALQCPLLPPPLQTWLMHRGRVGTAGDAAKLVLLPETPMEVRPGTLYAVPPLGTSSHPVPWGAQGRGDGPVAPFTHAGSCWLVVQWSMLGFIQSQMQGSQRVQVGAQGPL